ncbi:hypothetical protein KO494_11535 [Lacinutrix sp. C3R15]|uniref:hypothetical protein n=1 Tax=Flavobacteriaceae TaxID=49546 RepID=UPI001C091830|nr:MULTISPECIES: hypothetical protein [Flavobacteriaceae]MBU2940168.1 hypothetical protein [Lacinutrix sp. C3R15]MDO6623485.1 hypothetical protein [Oceanihabitans sp. 1_MG-2023]
MKNKFINSEIWSLTIGGAFQRANVYKPDVLEKDKKDFKFMLKTNIELHLFSRRNDAMSLYI